MNPERPPTSSDIKVSIDTLLKFIEPYNGDRDNLNAWITNCDRAFLIAQPVQYNILFAFIQSRLHDKAQSVCSNSIFPTWENLKDHLKSRLGDKKHQNHLLIELQNCKQLHNEPISQYILRLETALKRLLASIKQSSNDTTYLQGKIENTEDLALLTFKLGTSPQISQMLRYRNPETLNEAFNMALEEEKIQWLINSQNRNKITCNICNKSGHSSNNCYKKQNSTFSDRPNQYKKIHQISTNTPNLLNQSSQSSQNIEKFCNYCKTNGHLIFTCEKRKFNNQKYGNTSFIDQQRPNFPNRATGNNQNQNQNNFVPRNNHNYASRNNNNYNPATSSRNNNNNYRSTTTSRDNNNYRNNPSDNRAIIKKFYQSFKLQPDPGNQCRPEESTTNTGIINLSDSGNMKSQPYYVTLRLSNTHQDLKFLVDTGSSISIIKSELLADNCPIFKNEILTLKGITESENLCKTLGYANLEIFLKNQSINHKFHIVHFDQNLSLKYDGIIGNDLFETYKVKIDYERKNLIISNSFIPLLNNHFKDRNIMYTLSPRSETIVKCNIRNPRLKEGIISDVPLLEGVFISNAITKVDENNQAFISIINTLEREVKIKRLNLVLEPLEQINHNQINSNGHLSGNFTSVLYGEKSEKVSPDSYRYGKPAAARYDGHPEKILSISKTPDSRATVIDGARSQETSSISYLNESLNGSPVTVNDGRVTQKNSSSNLSTPDEKYISKSNS